MKAQESSSMHPTKMIRIDEGAAQSHIDTLVKGRSNKRSTSCWTLPRGRVHRRQLGRLR